MIGGWEKRTSAAKEAAEKVVVEVEKRTSGAQARRILNRLRTGYKMLGASFTAKSDGRSHSSPNAPKAGHWWF
jgi:hypothetical protein